MVVVGSEGVFQSFSLVDGVLDFLGFAFIFLSLFPTTAPSTAAGQVPEPVGCLPATSSGRFSLLFLLWMGGQDFFSLFETRELEKLI